jgi:hypothetical protein
VAVAAALLVLAPFVALSAIALTASYTSVIVPATCAETVSPIPLGRTIDVPGRGSGVLLAADGERAVAVVIDTTPRPRPVDAYLVDQAASVILWQVTIASDAVVAGIDAGIIFLWDDKIGYAVSASTGRPLSALVRSDDYRGIFTSGDGRRLQLDAEVTAIGLAGDPLSYRTFSLAGVVGGCTFGMTGDGG